MAWPRSRESRGAFVSLMPWKGLGMQDASRPSAGVLASDCDLATRLGEALSVTKRDSVQKLIAAWSAAGVPIIVVQPEIRGGRVVITVYVGQATAKILKILPCDIDGFPIVLKKTIRSVKSTTAPAAANPRLPRSRPTRKGRSN